MKHFILVFLLSTAFIGLSQSNKQYKVATKFVLGLQYGKYNKIHKSFSDTIKNLMPSKDLERTMISLESSNGTLDSIRLLKATKSKELGLFIYKMYYHLDKALILRLTVSEKNEISGIFFKPSKFKASYLEPREYGQAAYKDRNISLPTPHGDLAAKLTMPISPQKCPVVILVHGSGAHDMDESIYHSKVFYDLTLGFLDSGIATFRYDKRNYVYGSKFKDTSTVYSETIEDVLNAIDILKSQPGIDTNRIYVLGHSLGAYCAPRIAAMRKNVKGIIMLGAPCRPLYKIIPLQFKYLKENTSQAISEEVVQEYMQIADSIDSDAFDKDTSHTMLMGFSSAYWRYIKAYDIKETLLSLNLPVYIVQGERDYQVNMEEYVCFKESLGEKNNIVMTVIPGANHLFHYGKEKSVPAEYEKPGNVDKLVIKKISKWINNLN